MTTLIKKKARLHNELFITLTVDNLEVFSCLNHKDNGEQRFSIRDEIILQIEFLDVGVVLI